MVLAGVFVLLLCVVAFALMFILVFPTDDVAGAVFTAIWPLWVPFSDDPVAEREAESPRGVAAFSLEEIGFAVPVVCPENET